MTQGDVLTYFRQMSDVERISESVSPDEAGELWQGLQEIGVVASQRSTMGCAPRYAWLPSLQLTPAISTLRQATRQVTAPGS